MEIRETISEKIDGCNLLCNEKYAILRGTGNLWFFCQKLQMNR